MSAHVQRTGWLASPPTGAAVEITARHVAAVALASQGGGAVVAGYAAETLGAGIVEPALNAPNVHDAAALSAALRAALDKLTPRPKRVALVLPDTVAKVSLVRFEKVPAKAQDLDQLIRWQVRKAAPFRIEDAQISWQPAVELPNGGREYLVTMARRDIVASYESACTAAGVYAGVVDIASLNLVNAVLATASAPIPGDWLLVHVSADYATLAVVRGPHLIFFRNRTDAGPMELVDLVHQTAMYHEDRLGGGGFSRAIVAGAAQRGAEQAEWIRDNLADRLGSPVEALDFREAVPLRDRISVGAELMDALAPGVGVLMRERVA